MRLLSLARGPRHGAEYPDAKPRRCKGMNLIWAVLAAWREVALRFCVRGLVLVVCLAMSAPLPAQSEPLRWGGDAEGGAPFVEADPNDPGRLVGFDVEIAGILAAGLGRE